MSVPEAEIRKGDVSSPGEAEQLPQGAAQATNDALASVATPDPISIEYVRDPAEDGTEGFRPADEIDEILFADPDNPAPISRPQDLRKFKRPIPNELLRQLPVMKAMASDPRAPRAVKAAYYALLKRLEIENKL